MCLRSLFKTLLQGPTFWGSIIDSLMNLVHSNDAIIQFNPLNIDLAPLTSTMCKEG